MWSINFLNVFKTIVTKKIENTTTPTSPAAEGMCINDKKLARMWGERNSSHNQQRN